MAEDACGNKQKNQPALTIPVMWAKMISVLPFDPDLSGFGFFVFNRGPVAQLGARFHGMEEVVGSIPTRSTILSISYELPKYSRGRPTASMSRGLTIQCW